MEYEIDEKKEIHGSFSMSKNKLLKTINDYARKKTYTIKRLKSFTLTIKAFIYEGLIIFYVEFLVAKQGYMI